ncbi:hypothetical protein MFLO_01160 [Listeria floridensis FSL S10-1187]|uniref:Uncharacterized protein n=1 Tax=Listeria floridensis FSL S10-1187 TaxID=1265817 RepID=A0ABN0RIK4_9LIST|nr:hypothetical protein [Listeria floridensis]EUJ33796.1 hypothetical protein MFLO_01160 [Listeria floridensis FSL S10-1187]
MKKSGGGLSSAEEVYLDAANALVFTQGMKLNAQKHISELKEMYQKEIEKADDLWQDTLKDARFIGEILSDNEIIQALADGGATEAEIRLKPKAEYEKTVAELKAIEQEFDETIQTTQKAIQEMIEKDQELAKQISEG